MYGANCDSVLMTVIDNALMTVIQIWKDFIKIFYYLLNIILGRTLIEIMKYRWYLHYNTAANLNYKNRRKSWRVRDDCKWQQFSSD